MTFFRDDDGDWFNLRSFCEFGVRHIDGQYVVRAWYFDKENYIDILIGSLTECQDWLDNMMKNANRGYDVFGRIRGG